MAGKSDLVLSGSFFRSWIFFSRSVLMVSHRRISQCSAFIHPTSILRLLKSQSYFILSTARFPSIVVSCWLFVRILAGFSDYSRRNWHMLRVLPWEIALPPSSASSHRPFSDHIFILLPIPSALSDPEIEWHWADYLSIDESISYVLKSARYSDKRRTFVAGKIATSRRNPLSAGEKRNVD